MTGGDYERLNSRYESVTSERTAALFHASHERSLSYALQTIRLGLVVEQDALGRYKIFRTERDENRRSDGD